jgi:Family of unknown function (DUF5670)
MLTLIGIVLLVVWLSDYAFHLAAGSLVHLLLVLAVFALLVDLILNRGGRLSNDQPPTRTERWVRTGSRWFRGLARSR